MSDEIKQPQPVQSPQFKVTEPDEGIAHIYANVSHLTWTGMDLTVQLYHLLQPNRDIPLEKDSPNNLMQTASVTFTWAAAKTFHKLLSEVLERYEKANGPIKIDFGPI